MTTVVDPILDALRLTWSQLQFLSPRLLSAILLLIFGWLLARLVRKGLIRLLRLLRLESAAEQAGIESFLMRGGVPFTTVTLIATVVYWLLMLVVALTVFNVLGLQVSGPSSIRWPSYLPNVLVALVIVVFGAMLSRFIGATVETYLNNIGVERARSIGYLAKGALLTFVLTAGPAPAPGRRRPPAGGLRARLWRPLPGARARLRPGRPGLGGRHHPAHLEVAMIVDCHVHLNNYEEDTVESLSRRLAELNRVMRLNRVDIAVILTSYKVTPGRPSTAEGPRGRPGPAASVRRGGTEPRAIRPRGAGRTRAPRRRRQAQGPQALPGVPVVLPQRPEMGAGLPVRRAAPDSGHDPLRRHLRPARAR